MEEAQTATTERPKRKPLVSQQNGTILGRWMRDHGVKDGDLAKKVGISRIQVLRLRLGQYRPSLATARALQKITGIDAGKLMAGDP